MVCPDMPMNEPLLVPNLEASADARNVEAVRLFDRRCIRAALDLYRVEKKVLAIKETDTIRDQLAPPCSRPVTQSGCLKVRLPERPLRAVGVPHMRSQVPCTESSHVYRPRKTPPPRSGSHLRLTGNETSITGQGPYASRASQGLIQ